MPIRSRTGPTTKSLSDPKYDFRYRKMLDREMMLRVSTSNAQCRVSDCADGCRCKEKMRWLSNRVRLHSRCRCEKEQTDLPLRLPTRYRTFHVCYEECESTRRRSRLARQYRSDTIESRLLVVTLISRTCNQRTVFKHSTEMQMPATEFFTRKPWRATGDISEPNFLFRDRLRQSTVVFQKALDAFSKHLRTSGAQSAGEGCLISEHVFTVGSSGLNLVQHWLSFGGE